MDNMDSPLTSVCNMRGIYTLTPMYIYSCIYMYIRLVTRQRTTQTWNLQASWQGYKSPMPTGIDYGTSEGKGWGGQETTLHRAWSRADSPLLEFVFSSDSWIIVSFIPNRWGPSWFLHVPMTAPLSSQLLCHILACTLQTFYYKCNIIWEFEHVVVSHGWVEPQRERECIQRRE